MICIYFAKNLLYSVVYDFDSAGQNAREKEIKRQTLFEIIDFITSGTGRLPDQIFEAVVDMISKNLFRSLPPTQGG